MQLDTKHIALIATDGFEDSELTQPLDALREAGAEVTMVSIKPDTITGKNDTEVAVDALVQDVESHSFDGLVIPGGVVNPDILRTDEHAVAFVREFFEQHKPVGAICHGPWLLVEADVVDGRTVTSWPSLRTDLRNAGANWVDEEVVVDDGLVTSRNPDDLPAFCSKLIEEFSEGKHEEQTA